MHLFSSREDWNDVVPREELELKNKVSLGSILQNKKARPRFRDVWGKRHANHPRY